MNQNLASHPLTVEGPTGNGRTAAPAEDRAAPITDGQLRRWLTLLHQPDRLAAAGGVTSLLRAHDRFPEHASPVEVGRAAADLLRNAIQGLQPPREATRDEWLPYEILDTCFVQGAKRFQAANKLGLSERQTSRERTRAIKLLRDALEVPAGNATIPGPRYQPEPIPAILGFLARPPVSKELDQAVEKHRLVRVHGPPGVGKTSLVAELATDRAERMPTFWYRFRQGLNDSLSTLIFELGEYLRSRRQPELAQYMAETLPDPDPGLATRLALKGLAGSRHLLVLDDFHFAEEDGAIPGLLEEAVGRLPDLCVVVIGRRQGRPGELAASLEVPSLKLLETEALLVQLGIGPERGLTHTIHNWTEGIPHLVKLAASWLKTATSQEVERGLGSLVDAEEVQAFLLEGITELMGPDERTILETASVFRNRFTDDALAFVSERTRGEVQDISRRLVRAYVATRSRSGDVAFFHNTVRDYVYSRLSMDRRRTLHERAAIWYRRQENQEEAGHHDHAAAAVEGQAVVG